MDFAKSDTLARAVLRQLTCSLSVRDKTDRRRSAQPESKLNRRAGDADVWTGHTGLRHLHIG